MKKLKRDWKRELVEKIIADILDYRGNENLCEEEDCIGESCPTCGAMRNAIEGCEGIVRCYVD